MKWEDIPVQDRKKYDQCPMCDKIFPFNSAEFHNHVCGECSDGCIIGAYVSDYCSLHFVREGSQKDVEFKRFLFCPICGKKLEGE